MDKVPPPATLPVARKAYLSPLLARLLELHSKEHLSSLAEQCQEAVATLPDTDRPTTYEGLLDVARFCIDDEPGWPSSSKAVLLAGHPRIGAKVPMAGAGQGMSKSSQTEQQAATVDVESDQALAQLNLIYERRFPGLRYVTFVAGRPRSAIAQELKTFLGEPSLDDAPDSLVVDTPSAEAVRWADARAKPVHAPDEETWTVELGRGLDALFEIAMNRASKITEDDYESPSRVTPFIDENEVFDEPFLTLERFKELVQKHPLLHTFFEADLPSSFYLVPPPPSQETPREALATLAAVAVTGGGGGDATRRRVRGLLGGLWGEMSDRVGKVAGRETRTGPRPAFGREETLRGEEFRAKGTKMPLSPHPGGGPLPGNVGGTDLEDAEASLKLATQRLTDADRSHFVIDEPANAGEEGEGEDEGEGEGEDEDLGMDRLGIEDGAQVQSSEKDKELAKGAYYGKRSRWWEETLEKVDQGKRLTPFSFLLQIFEQRRRRREVRCFRGAERSRRKGHKKPMPICQGRPPAAGRSWVKRNVQ